MNKKIIAIVSILKPLKDPRHYERFALSLAKTNKYEINIIGNDEKKPDESDISFHSNGSHGRNLFHRLRLQWNSWKTIFELKPDLLIICSAELLPFMLIYRTFSKAKIVYDVQENYYLNFRHLGEYGWLHKHLLSRVVRLWEKLSHLVIDHYILAEKCYADQLKFIGSNYTILENKTVLESPISPGKKNSNRPIRFLFSGTISVYSGIHRIVDLIGKLSRTKIDFQFVIIGQVFSRNLEALLKEIESSNVQLIVSSRPISHQQILSEIAKADVGVIAYQSNPVNRNKIPSKLYEYTAFGLPYLVEKDSYWAEVGNTFGGAIEVDFLNISLESIIERSGKYKSPSMWRARINSLWGQEESKFIYIINTLII